MRRIESLLCVVFWLLLVVDVVLWLLQLTTVAIVVLVAMAAVGLVALAGRCWIGGWAVCCTTPAHKWTLQNVSVDTQHRWARWDAAYSAVVAEDTDAVIKLEPMSPSRPGANLLLHDQRNDAAALLPASESVTTRSHDDRSARAELSHSPAVVNFTDLRAAAEANDQPGAVLALAPISMTPLKIVGTSDCVENAGER